MRVVVDGWAWLPKADLTPAQVVNLKRALTVVPVKTGDHPGEDPVPIPLFEDNGTHLGIPRSYFLANRRPVHQVEMRVTTGSSDWFPVEFSGSLRPEQQTSVREVLSLFKAGQLGGIIQAKPGWGKTVCALAIVAELGVPALVVVHKEFLMDQWQERIEKFLPGARVGRVQQDQCDFRGMTIVMGMVHSLAKGGYPGLWDWPGIVITDECFVGTQKVLTSTGTVPISEVREGDEVFNAIGCGSVTACGSREVPLRDVVHVSLEDGSEMLCTQSHPFLTGRGWVRAEELRQSDVVLTNRGCTDIVRRHGEDSNTWDVRDVWEAALREKWEEVLLPHLYGTSETTLCADVQGVWDAACEAGQGPLLLACLRSELDGTHGAKSSGEEVSIRKGVASGESTSRGGGVTADDREKPDARPYRSGDRVEKTSSDGSCPARKGWERERDSGTTAGSARSVGFWLGCGTRGCDACQEDSGRAPSALQDRHREYGDDDGDRGGRSVPLRAIPEGAGSAEDSIPGVLRVACVSRAEPSDLERFGVGFSSPGRVRVYNLSVSGHPSYVLDSGVVVHNCHRIGARTWSVVPPMFKARYRLGFTATPRRKDLADDVFWHHIGPILFAGKEERLKPTVKRVWSNFQLVKTDRFNPQLASRALLLRFLCASRHRNDLIVDQVIQATQKGRKCMVLSERLEHLKRLEAGLEEHAPSPSTGWYVGGRTKEQLAEAAQAQVILATVQYAAEGLDIPSLDTLFLTTPMSDVEQAVGRILRPVSGKKPPIVVDFRDDSVPLFEGQARKRDQFYRRVG